MGPQGYPPRGPGQGPPPNNFGPRGPMPQSMGGKYLYSAPKFQSASSLDPLPAKSEVLES